MTFHLYEIRTYLTMSVFLYYIECNNGEKNMDCQNRVYGYESG